MLLLVVLIALIGLNIPKETNRVHLGEGLDQWRGDSVMGIYEAAKHPLGNRYVDINQWTCLDDIVCLHSHTARITGYHYIKKWHRIGRRKMTDAELDRHIHQWKAKDVKRWHRTKRNDGTFESKVTPLLFSEALDVARPRYVVICPELKDPRFARDPRWAERMKSMTDARQMKVYPMTLVTMAGWGQKLMQFHMVGYEVALLQHGARIPADLIPWKPYIDAYWGNWGTGHPARATL